MHTFEAPAPGVHRVSADPIENLVARWEAEDTPFVLVDPAGRHARDVLADSRSHVDLQDSPVHEPAVVDALLSEHGHAVLDAGAVPERERVGVLGQALIATRVSRGWSGSPEWIVVDDAQDLLADPALPPEALDLSAGGYCLVIRKGASVPPPVRAWLEQASEAALASGRPGVQLLEIP